MSFVIAAAAVAGGVGAYKTIAGAKQVKDGKRMAANNKRPYYSRPGEAVDALNIAERSYLNNGMPGADILQNRIGSSAATAFNNATQGASSSADILDAATKINVNTNDANNNLTIQEAQFKNQAQDTYLGQLANSANYTDKEFSYNKDQPYQTTAAAASALIGSGNQNIYSGINDIGGAAVGALGAMGGGKTIDGNQMDRVESISALPAGPINPSVSGKLIFDRVTGKPRLVQQ